MKPVIMTKNWEESMEYLDVSHPEWGRMWDELAYYPMNDGDHLCINGSDCWEYMGSSADHHHLRHANHPATNSAEYFYIERARAAVGWA
ncbi:4-diphosphocytidyl-2C-methyl-D-erythritol kinase [Gilvimarinus polysaccharolyticus]|uniref:4-diphosphocytidyl-2C-methyl-D-erythritol kinase n=1 Tax=Gilvimarinus polysaccharolyticus TaxID=863921 RepID=UPI001E2836A0|nr:4-diphosphocytidyl-2C-methyl-D-erythritol kinase [Gilvimarinus polysaccharolyticus]